MGYEVSKRRVYGPTDRYCNGSGISVLCSTLEEAELTYEHLATQTPGDYPNAVFLIDLPADKVLRSTWPTLADVDVAMRAAWRRRYAAQQGGQSNG